jgi:hypothetical protein
VSSPSGGVASRTLPAAGAFERDDDDALADDFVEDVEDLVDADFFEDDVFDDEGPDAPEVGRFGVERFLDGPHVVMTDHTVPRGCHTEP